MPLTVFPADYDTALHDPREHERCVGLGQKFPTCLDLGDKAVQGGVNVSFDLPACLRPHRFGGEEEKDDQRRRTHILRGNECAYNVLFQMGVKSIGLYPL